MQIKLKAVDACCTVCCAVGCACVPIPQAAGGSVPYLLLSLYGLPTMGTFGWGWGHSKISMQKLKEGSFLKSCLLSWSFFLLLSYFKNQRLLCFLALTQPVPMVSNSSACRWPDLCFSLFMLNFYSEYLKRQKYERCFYGFFSCLEILSYHNEALQNL